MRFVVGRAKSLKTCGISFAARGNGRTFGSQIEVGPVADPIGEYLTNKLRFAAFHAHCARNH